MVKLNVVWPSGSAAPPDAGWILSTACGAVSTKETLRQHFGAGPEDLEALLRRAHHILTFIIHFYIHSLPGINRDPVAEGIDIDIFGYGAV